MTAKRDVWSEIRYLRKQLDAADHTLKKRPMKTQEEQEKQLEIDRLRKQLQAVVRHYRIHQIQGVLDHRVLRIIVNILGAMGLTISIILIIVCSIEGMGEHSWMTVSAIIGGGYNGISFLRQLRSFLRKTGDRRPRSKPPLRLLDASVKALWSTKTYNQVFKPVRADIVREWRDARKSKEWFRAWWIKHVLGPFAIIESALRQLPWSAIKKVVSTFIELSK